MWLKNVSVFFNVRFPFLFTTMKSLSTVIILRIKKIMLRIFYPFLSYYFQIIFNIYYPFQITILFQSQQARKLLKSSFLFRHEKYSTSKMFSESRVAHHTKFLVVILGHIWFLVIILGHIWFLWFPSSHTRIIQNIKLYTNRLNLIRPKQLIPKKLYHCSHFMRTKKLFLVIILGHIWFVWFPSSHTRIVLGNTLWFVWHHIWSLYDY